MGTRRLALFACAVSFAPAVAQRAPPVDSSAAIDPSRARIAFGATGRTIPHGHGSIVAHYLFLPTATLGVHDRVTLVAGTAVPIITGPGELPYWVGGKVGIVQRSTIFVSAGGLHFRTEAGDPGHTIVYAVATGDLDRLSLTLAGVRGFPGDRDIGTGAMIGIEWRLDREWTALAEAWSVPLWGVDPPAVFGLRWSNSRAAFTAGFASWQAPYVDFAVQW